MYLVEKGQLAVLSSTGETIAILREGNFFGELALLATARRSANVTTLAHTDLMVLTAYDLQLTMKDFPESAKKIRQAALERLADLNVTRGGDTDDLMGVSKEAVKEHADGPRNPQNIQKVVQNYYVKPAPQEEGGGGGGSGSGMHMAAAAKPRQSAATPSVTINAKNTSGAHLAIDPAAAAVNVRKESRHIPSTSGAAGLPSPSGGGGAGFHSPRKSSIALGGPPGPSPLGKPTTNQGQTAGNQYGEGPGNMRQSVAVPGSPVPGGALYSNGEDRGASGSGLPSAASVMRRQGRRMSALRTSSL